ncbi:hypothetical protein P0Y35_15560 [Kiritimatiellaeota bacterium B1221]|nr:hypothetical protein [Kiritimatiellaeota bacterium B1221]
MKPMVVSPPLRGEWNVLNSPGDAVPSHGTHAWGMTYAYDFYRLAKTPEGEVWHQKSTSKYLSGQVQLADTFGWGEPVYAPIGGGERSGLWGERTSSFACGQ